MNSQTYVTNPVLWETFYKTMDKKSSNSNKRKLRKNIQSGGGLYRRFKGSYLIPVNNNASDTQQNTIQTKQVSPVEADVNRAKSEFENDSKKPHVKLLKSIKGRKMRKLNRKKKTFKKVTSSRKTKTKKGTTKRKRKANSIETVWDKPQKKRRT